MVLISYFCLQTINSYCKRFCFKRSLPFDDIAHTTQLFFIPLNARNFFFSLPVYPLPIFISSHSILGILTSTWLWHSLTFMYNNLILHSLLATHSKITTAAFYHNCPISVFICQTIWFHACFFQPSMHSKPFKGQFLLSYISQFPSTV